MKKIVTLFLSLSLVFAGGCGNASVTSIRFGSAAVGGMYSAFANAYTQIVSQDDENLQFSVRSTAGSAANIRLLSDGYIQMAIAQADLTDDAYHGTGDFDKKPLHGYSAVAALYTEACQIVVRADSDIHSVDDLLGKKVSIGEEESGTERNAKQIFEVYGLSDELVDCENLDYTQAAEALVSGKIDAMFCTAGVQTTVIEELTRQCGIRLLSIDETHIQKLMAGNEAYFHLVKEEIPTLEQAKESYTVLPPGTGRDQKTFAVFYKKGKCMAVLDFIWGYPEENTGFIGLLMVAADGQGKGIGKKLFRHIRKAARENGLKKLRLGCYASNEPARNFWEKQGFRTVEIREKEAGELLVMEL